jgi:Flp pilus assembly pilin Flp
MRNNMLRIYLTVQTFLALEEGQDSAEYVFTVAALALAAVAGMGSLATGISNTFSTVSSDLVSYLN